MRHRKRPTLSPYLGPVIGGPSVSPDPSGFQRRGRDGRVPFLQFSPTGEGEHLVRSASLEDGFSSRVDGYRGPVSILTLSTMVDRRSYALFAN